jgi:hypothetical protein
VRITLMFLIALVIPLSPRIIEADEVKGLDEGNVAVFAKSYEKQLDKIDAIYHELTFLEPPLRDRSEDVITLESLEDRRKSIAYFKQTAQQFQANPQDFTLALRLFIQTETLTDDLSGMSQICFDNDQEELAQRLNAFAMTLKHDKHFLGEYTLRLSDQVEQHVQKLERENQALRARRSQRKLKTRSRTSPAP